MFKKMKNIPLVWFWICILTSAIFWAGCHQSSHNGVGTNKITKPAATTTGGSPSVKPPTNRDTLLIQTKCAVSLWLDTAELEKRRKKYGDDFYPGADDFAYYASYSVSVLKAKNLPVTNVSGYKFLKFLQGNGAVTIVRIDTLSEIFNLYLFDPSKEPYKADITDMESEYRKFYQQ